MSSFPLDLVLKASAVLAAAGFVQELFPDVDGGVLVRLKDEAKTELAVARDRVRDLKERLGL